MMSNTNAFDQWAVVELFGHQKIAGRVTEEQHFGSILMRVDVPSTEARPGFTKFYGGSAIYALTPVSEDIARAMAVSLNARPVEEWRIAGLLSSGAHIEVTAVENDLDSWSDGNRWNDDSDAHDTDPGF
jgi:hypothetical protein